MNSKTVNRIYQGRVVKVELENNTGWEEYKNWQPLLLNHHKVFQDAVNYYLCGRQAEHHGFSRG